MGSEETVGPGEKHSHPIILPIPAMRAAFAMMVNVKVLGGQFGESRSVGDIHRAGSEEAPLGISLVGPGSAFIGRVPA